MSIFGRFFKLKPRALKFKEVPGKLNFLVQQYQGSPVLNEDQERLTRQEELAVAQKILVRGFFGWFEAAVTEIKGDTATAHAGKSTICWLEYGRDDRRCWVCALQGNLAAIEKINFEPARA